jgi:hypothetical protein
VAGARAWGVGQGQGEDEARASGIGGRADRLTLDDVPTATFVEI